MKNKLNRRKFINLLGAGFFVTFFAGCGKVETATEIVRGDFSVEDKMLNSGYKMPVLGLGTWTLNDKQAAECVYYALKIGYRLIDTARYYGNEVGVGRGVRKAIAEGLCKRENIFVTSKILPTANADSAIESSLANLNIDYVDLMLIHQSGAYDEQTYKSLEKFSKSGILRSIGISNYYTPQEFDRMTRDAEIVPAVVQNENHIWYQNTNLQEYLKKFGTVIESWYPFGGRGNTEKIFANSTLQSLAGKYQKSVAQIILRWQIQAGYIAIPGSKNPAHIEENFNIFDFELSANDMQKIYALNKNHRFENW